MATVFVGIGSNIDREANIRSGLAALRARFGDLRVSTVYATHAIGFKGDDFYNLVVAFETLDPPHEVVRLLRKLEDQHGRTRHEKRYSSRRLDLDLLLYGDAVIHSDDLHIPREDVTRYDFVLGPLVELAPDLVHPETAQRLVDLWRRVPDGSSAMRPVDLGRL